MPEYAAAQLLHYGKKEREVLRFLSGRAITSCLPGLAELLPPARELASKFRRDESLLQEGDRVSSEKLCICFLAGEEGGGTHE